MPKGYFVALSSQSPSQYQGPASHDAWPLEDFRTPEAERLTALVQEETQRRADDGRDAPDLIASHELANEYIDACRHLGLSVTLHYCDEQRVVPAGGVALGWDVVNASLTYSVVDDELCYERSKFPEHRARLNRFGLFDNTEDLERYLDHRKTLGDPGDTLESGLSYYRFHVARCAVERP